MLATDFLPHSTASFALMEAGEELKISDELVATFSAVTHRSDWSSLGC
jgi:hypothetical protein